MLFIYKICPFFIPVIIDEQILLISCPCTNSLCSFFISGVILCYRIICFFMLRVFVRIIDSIYILTFLTPNLPKLTQTYPNFNKHGHILAKETSIVRFTKKSIHFPLNFFCVCKSDCFALKSLLMALTYENADCTK